MTLPDPFPPPWAKAGYGVDRGGCFAVLDLGEGVTMELRWIPPGSFLMGSPPKEPGRNKNEGPQHRVTLSGFWLARTLCTQAQWLAVMGINPSYFAGDLQRPVEQVNWDDCQGFCQKLTARFPGLAAGLPSEAQWEYACRAGTASAFNDGSACTKPGGKDPALDRLGWFDDNSEHHTHPVGLKAVNAWGLLDMHGNVWEWCADWWKNHYEANPVTNPSGPAHGGDRVVRGGSWIFPARYCRSAIRYRVLPRLRGRYLGFRLAAGQGAQPSPASGAGPAGQGEGGARPAEPAPSPDGRA